MESESCLEFHPDFENQNLSDDKPSSSIMILNRTNSNKHKFHRCKTEPALVILPENLNKSTDPKPDSASLLRQATLLLVLYLSLGVLIYIFNRDHFSGIETHPLVDAIYFCIVTMCTIGYGDIAPVTPTAKLFSCFYVIVGFGFIDIMLSGVLNYVLDLQENMMLNSDVVRLEHNEVEAERVKWAKGAKVTLLGYVFDYAKGRMRIRLKVGLALGVVLMSIGIGVFVLYFVERLDWVDSLYLSVLSVTTVGYGDKAFETLHGRLFASIWLLFSTLMVARAFLYLAEARIDKRHRKVANWVLNREITVQDLLDADINNNGFLSKSEYILFKLKEMGKIGERDILEICNQFGKLDSSNSGKITLHRLLAGRSI
ncbi:two-pore potassium channel 5 [Rutidosis leptorrhynchoides]|uniref:two-pore potassium channel 5 n=1 Tax=Rutidosis leptorrhynchoides TaxID=125765 RepID=UPI003A990BE8